MVGGRNMLRIAAKDFIMWQALVLVILEVCFLQHY
jgi:hypothetical protein